MRSPLPQLALAFVFCSAAVAESPPAAPYFNPHWAQSTYPVSRAIGESSGVAGPTAASRALRPNEVQYAPTGPANSWGGLYSSPYPNGKRVIWVGGYDRIAKVDADTLQILTTHSLGGKTYFGESEIEQHIATMDSLADPKQFVEHAINVWLEPWEATNSFYRLLSNKNEMYIAYRTEDGVTSIRVYGEEDAANPASRIQLRREWKVPTDLSRSTICGLNMTSDGHVIVSLMDGTVIALAQDFKTYTSVRLPAKNDEARTQSAKSSKEAARNEDIFDTFVRNGLTTDDRGGIYIVSRDYMQRVQWTGTRLSLDEKDGAWKAPYSNQSGRGSGTTPSLMGWGPKEDHLVVITDGDVRNNAMVFWRDAIPANWKGLPGQDRRVAGITPVTFDVSKDEPLQIELVPVVFGNGTYFQQCYTSEPNNSKALLEEDTPSKKWLAAGFGFHFPGYGSRGGAKVEWDSKTRTLKTAWRTQTNFLCVSNTVSRANSILYGWGARDGEWTVEGTDWNTGKSVFHYTLGKSHRFNAMGGLVEMAPDGALLCSGCGFGLVRVMPKP